jgi:hypothetical protein
MTQPPEQYPTVSVLAFQPHQIVCLEHGSSRLYAEVVQVAEQRPVCWVRPLALIHEDVAISLVAPSLELHDLRQGSDLLLPIALFRLAMDTEVMPVLTHLYTKNTDISKTDQTEHQHLSQFVRRVCLAHRSLFTMPSP